MYSRTDLSATRPEICYNDSHVTVTCYFDASGTPIDVDAPTFSLYSESVTGTDMTSQLTILRPLQKDPSNTTGKYLTTFLTKDSTNNNISPGNYVAKMSGLVGSVEYTATGSLVFHEVSRIQWLIETLLESLKGKYNLLVPDNLMVVDPRARSWGDGECYGFLRRALADINSTPPILTSQFTFDLGDWPEEVVNFLIMGAQLYALFASASLEAQNYFDIQVPIKVNLYRGNEFRNLMTFIRDGYQAAIAAWKTNYWFISDSDEYILIMSRVPIRISRPMSDAIFMHSIMY